MQTWRKRNDFCMGPIEGTNVRQADESEPREGSILARNRANRKRPKHSTNQTQHPHPNLKPFKVHLPGLPNLSQARPHPNPQFRITPLRASTCEAAASGAWPASPTLQSRTVKKGRPRMMLTSLHHEICGSVTSVRMQVAFLSGLFGVFFPGLRGFPCHGRSHATRQAAVKASSLGEPIRSDTSRMSMCALSQA